MKTDRYADSFDREGWARRKNEIAARLPVSRVVQRVLQLKKSGAEWTGLCPFHNEKTPSFTVNDKKGFYHCFGCGQHGDAIGFVMARQGLDFKAAIELLESENGLRHLQASRPAPPAPKVQQREDLDKAAKVQRIWAKCRWDPIVARYLEGRAIICPLRYGVGDAAVNDGWPADLLYHPGLYHGIEKRELPCMVAAMRRPDGRLVAIHRTYLQVSGVGVTKAGTGSDKRMLGDVAGAVIRLGPNADRMTGGEGIETTLSAMQLTKRSGLAFGARAGMATYSLPFECGDFVYAADRNKVHSDPSRSRVGEAAAWKGAKLNGVGRKVAVKVPNLPGQETCDFNDVVIEAARVGALPSPFARAIASQKARGIDHGLPANVVRLEDRR